MTGRRGILIRGEWFGGIALLAGVW
jgi:hypothetical protein